MRQSITRQDSAAERWILDEKSRFMAAVFEFLPIVDTESRRVLATLIRTLDDFDLAEDALGEAFQQPLKRGLVMVLLRPRLDSLDISAIVPPKSLGSHLLPIPIY